MNKLREKKNKLIKMQNSMLKLQNEIDALSPSVIDNYKLVSKSGAKIYIHNMNDLFLTNSFEGDTEDYYVSLETVADLIRDAKYREEELQGIVNDH